MLQKLHQELPECLGRLREDLARRDVTAVCEHAHKLNGLAGYFCIQALALSARDLKRMAHSARLDEAQPYFDSVEREITRALSG